MNTANIDLTTSLDSSSNLFNDTISSSNSLKKQEIMCNRAQQLIQNICSKTVELMLELKTIPNLNGTQKNKEAFDERILKSHKLIEYNDPIEENQDIINMFSELESIYKTVFVDEEGEESEKKNVQAKITVDSLMQKLHLKPDTYDNHLNKIENKDEDSMKLEEDNLNTELKKSEHIQNLEQQRLRLMNEVDRKNDVIKEIISQYRMMGIELNLLTN